MRCYIFDIDGTLADASHRMHFIKPPPLQVDGMKEPFAPVPFQPNWDAFFDACVDDKPIKHMQNLLDDMHQYWTKFVYVSGRSDRVRKQTEEWLDRHYFPSGAIYMRKAGDHRPDDTVKAELLARVRADGYDPIMAFDDRDRVVKMWRTLGVPCAQVADGDF